MNRREGITAYVLLACAFAFGWASRAAEGFTGSWTIHRSDEPGKVEFALTYRHDGHSSNHESAWPVSAFAGLDLIKTGK